MENVPAKHAQRFAEVKELNLQTSRAWAIKEVFRSFWLCPGAKPAERYFGEWYGWAIRSRLAPIKKVARMCKAHLSNILTFFVHRLTNGPIEGLNRACPKRVDFRNVIRFDNGCREQKQTKAASGSAAVGFSEKFPGTVHTAPVVFRF
jgi:hypothetical protein